MAGPDGLFSGKVGDGPGDLDDAGVGAGGKSQPVDDPLQRGLAFVVQGTEPLQHLGGHLGVREDAGLPKPLPLDLPRLPHPLRDGGGRLSLPALDKCRCFNKGKQRL